MSGAEMTGSLHAFPEIVRLTFRQLLGRRRTLLLLLLAALPPLLALVFRAANQIDVSSFTTQVFDTVSMTIVLPLAAVLFGTGAFGAENDEGTILYLLAKPISRWVIVAAKAFAAVALSLALTVGSVLVAGAIELLPAGSVGVSATEAYVGAMVVGSLCYAVVFVAVSLFTRRALVIGIGYSLVWEGALSSLLPGIANLSIRQYALGVADGFVQLHTQPATLSPTTAVTLSVIVIVAALALATWRLMRFELPGSSD
jgi:ABC-2 type transport system permease protein